MPVKIPDALPATAILEQENIFVMTENRAMHQDIRPLRLLILNLMPKKIDTETQLLRKLSNTPLQIDVDFMYPGSHHPKNVAHEHLESFYTTFDRIEKRYYDGLIITGAPVELLDFEDVDYWPELCAILDWSDTHVHSVLSICWGAQAALYHRYGIPKHRLDGKMSGIFEHAILKSDSRWVRGFSDSFAAPHSRHTEVRLKDIEAAGDLEVIAFSEEAGVHMVKSTDDRRFFVTGHGEYDTGTLAGEYLRDRAKGIEAAVPRHYFPDDDPSLPPMNTWRASAQLMFSNWLNYYVYQTTAYDIGSTTAQGIFS